MPRSTNIVRYFRGNIVPAYVKNKSQLVAYVLEKYRNDEPISNGEFVFTLRCTRFGAVIHNLRHNDGWDIQTLERKDGEYVYYLVSTPTDKAGTSPQLKLLGGTQ
jgi:hypothetical protein